ncbi:MAG: hypothetical protein ACK4PI_09670 [Tepidisphaerales bacterium]
MRINRDSLPWVWATSAVLVVCVLTYIPYHRAALNGPSGGTWPGLIYGVIGTAMIVVAMLLTPRKKLRTLRVGRAYGWMQAHVWLGLASLPVILLHAGFRDGLWGSPFTFALMVVFIVIYVSGVVGLVLQNLMPVRLLAEVPGETIFEQIDHVIGHLRQEAEKVVMSASRPRGEEGFELEAIPAGAAAGGGAARAAVGESAGGVRATEAPPARDGAEALTAFYRQQVVPALADRGDVSVATPADFERLRATLPLGMQEAAADLQSIVEERRQLERQRRLHTWLHGWLWVHVPLSAAMAVMVVVHAVVALRYARPW